MTTKLYRRHQLPQWRIEDIIKHDYSYYFGFEKLKTLKPSQVPEDYEQERIRRKLSSFKVGQFDPIITDCDFHIICGHHRYKMLKDFYKDSKKVDNQKVKKFFEYQFIYPTYKEGLDKIFNDII